MKFDDATWARWGSWLDAIKDDLQTAIADVDVFRTFARVTHENGEWIAEHQGWYFCRFVGRCYSQRMALAVREQTKDNDSPSLMRILSQIRACAPEITFERYMRYFPPKKGRPPWQALTFKSVCDPTVETIDAFWEMKRKGLRTVGAANEPIHVPHNSATGFVTAFFAVVTGFALIWHIWWIVILGVLAAPTTILVFSWSDDREREISPSEIARLVRGRLRSEGAA